MRYFRPLMLAVSLLAAQLPLPAEEGTVLAEGEQPRSADGKTAHWAFQPVARPSVPPVNDGAWARNPIDFFVLARLERAGLRTSPEAHRSTLVRRLYLDLLGLPPPPEEVVAFLEDRRPGAYELLVERLLSSPHFGERWGRHWLDLARYADSDGYEDDKYRPDAWRYRDWVIRAINRDLPFDQFTIEQMAGDLLPGATYGQRIATGFHRMSLSNRGGAASVREEFRVKTAKERLNTTATVWLGLTVGCAQCHSHKYDPVSLREYYELYAFFNNADEEDIPAPPLPEKFMVRYRKELEAYRKKKFENNNNEPQPPSTKALTLAEHSEPRRSHIHTGGDFLRKGAEVKPGSPGFLPLVRPRGGRADRLDLARWIVDPANPLARRVTVNRCWQHLFGRGLVRTPEDFGLNGEPPSHPQLLDWLAAELLARGWSRKGMIKLIVTSATYRQASRMRDELLERDPDNLLFGRQSRFAVEAEIVRDLALSASDLLHDELGGPSVQPPLPAALTTLKALKNERFREMDEGSARYRRGVYTNVQRTFLFPALETFDASDPNVCCTRRDRSNTPLQALTLLNEPAFFECARALGLRMLERPGDRLSRLRRAFRRCLAREPDEGELATLEQLFEKQWASYREHRESARELVGNTKLRRKVELAEAAAWIGVARTILNLEEFITRE